MFANKAIRRYCYLLMTAVISVFTWGCTKSASEETKEVVWVNKPATILPDTEHFALASKAMGHDVGVTVQLPKDYSHSQKDYPVIYYLHGKGGSENSDIAGFVPFLRSILTKHNLPEPIVVFPNGGSRRYEGPLEEMIIKELIPEIEGRYRTKTDTRHRLLAGFSLGGAGAVRLSIFYPELFGGAASWGGGMWDQDTTLLETAEKSAPALKQSGFHALLVNGENDRPDTFIPLSRVFQQQAVPHNRLVLPDQGHDLGRYFRKTEAAYGEHLQSIWQAGR